MHIDSYTKATRDPRTGDVRVTTVTKSTGTHGTFLSLILLVPFMFFLTFMWPPFFYVCVVVAVLWIICALNERSQRNSQLTDSSTYRTQDLTGHVTPEPVATDLATRQRLHDAAKRKAR